MNIDKFVNSLDERELRQIEAAIQRRRTMQRGFKSLRLTEDEKLLVKQGKEIDAVESITLRGFRTLEACDAIAAYKSEAEANGRDTR